MAIFLVELARWLREAGLEVIEYPDWKHRARGSGGYSEMPLCVMWHHTASPASWDGQKDADYCAEGDEDAPLANLYIDRSGTVWVLAAGATNTNGKGKSIQFSRGTVPADSMNTRAIGIEMGNDGVGEPWPSWQIDAAFLASNVCNSHCGNLPTDMATHQFYAPDRKVDPATAVAVQGRWQPSSCTSSGTWDRSDVQAECSARAGGTLPPSDGDDDMIFDGFWQRDVENAGIYAIYKDCTKKWIPDLSTLNAMQALMTLNGAQSVQVNIQPDAAMFAAMGVVIGPRPADADEWGNPC